VRGETWRSQTKAAACGTRHTAAPRHACGTRHLSSTPAMRVCLLTVGVLSVNRTVVEVWSLDGCSCEPWRWRAQAAAWQRLDRSIDRSPCDRTSCLDRQTNYGRFLTRRVRSTDELWTISDSLFSATTRAQVKKDLSHRSDVSLQSNLRP
jgi:hypothetical protein